MKPITWAEVYTVMARNAVLLLLLAVTATHVAAQATDLTLRRFGSQPVSNAEVTQIAELVVSTGKRPWLLRSPHSMVGGLRVASLFLEPDVLGPRVSRGRMWRLEADGSPFIPPRSPWRIREPHVYAYVAIAGRRPGEILGEDDPGWPFIVQGEFDDDTLIGIVEFIRSEPSVPMPAFLRRVPAEAIVGIQRRDDAIVVGLRAGDGRSDSVWLVRKDGQWVITRSESSIA
jgi:hypothetical protein